MLQKEGLSAEVYTSTFTPLKARLAARAEGAVAQQCFVKMLVEVGSGKVLGLHMVGEDAPEIIQVGERVPQQRLLVAAGRANSVPSTAAADVYVGRALHVAAELSRVASRSRAAALLCHCHPHAHTHPPPHIRALRWL